MSLAVAVEEAPPGPQHVAIIMDGNGRWAKARGMPRSAGHRRGVDALREVVRGAGELGVPYLTLFGFSTENWSRPRDEVDFLMGLLRHYLRTELGTLLREGARLRVVGDRSRLPGEIPQMILDAERQTATNTRINVTIALDYGGRADIVEAARRLAQAARDGTIDPAQIDEAAFASHLATAGIPDPDVLIRTSGEQRISNFLLWQSAYAELIFTDVMWPDFSREHLAAAIKEFRRRERRYGSVQG